MMIRILFASVALWLCAFVLPIQAGDWPEWRGPTGQGLYQGNPLPTEFGPEKNIVWRREIPGLGWSTPAVVAGRVYLTTAIPKDRDYSLQAVCLDAATGGVLWEKEVFVEDTRTSPRIHSKNSHASPSPVVQDGKVFVHFGHLGTACLDVDGNIVWRTQELKYPPVHGAGGSPILVDGKLVFTCDGAISPFVAALDAATGKLRWKAPRSWDARKKFSFGTPLAITIDGQTQIIAPGSGGVAAYDPKDGSEIWKAFYEEGYSMVPRPVYGHGMIFMSTSFDTPVTMAIRVGGKGDVTETHVAWTLQRGAPMSVSPLLVGDELYLVSDRGLASCVEAKSGKPHWQESLGGEYTAAPIHADGNVYFTSEKGVVTIVKASRKFEILAKNAMKERTLASLAGVNGALYMRTEKAIYRIEQR